MAISLTGASNKVTFPASNIDLESTTKNFSFSLRFRQPTAGTFNRIVQIRDGDGSFVVAANSTDAYFAGKSVTANMGGFSTGRGEDYSKKHTGLTEGQWYHMTATAVNLYGVENFDTNHWQIESQVNGSAGIQDAQEFGTGDDTDEICFGSRCRTGTTTQSENDDQVAELAIWEDYLLTPAEQTALENGASPLTIAPHKLKAYIPLHSMGALVDLISGNTGTDAGSASATSVGEHPNVSMPVGAQVLQFTPVAGNAPLVGTTQTYTLSGNATPLTHQASLTATNQTYSLTGSDIVLTTGIVIPADTQTYDVTGVAAGLKRDLVLTADTQSYSWTGNDAGLQTLADLAADTQTYTLTGNAVNLTVAVDLVLSSDDFDAAVFEPGSSTVVGGETSTPTVTLVPRDLVEADKWLMLCARVLNANGKTPEFSYDATEHRADLFQTQNPVWRYLTEGRNDWKTFDNVSTVAKVVTFSNNTAFTGDIEVASTLRWHHFDTVAWVGELDSSPYVHEAASSAAATGLPKHVHAQFDPGPTTTNSFPNSLTDMYCLRITDDATQPDIGSKWPIVIGYGSHPQEDQGPYLAQQFVSFLLSGSATANALLKNYEFFWYDENPTGRLYGRERFYEGPGSTSDCNRSWDGTPTGTPTADVLAAIAVDVPGQLESVVTLHGAYNLTSPAFGAFFDSTNLGSQDFYDRMNTKQGGFDNEGLHPVGSASWYGESVGAFFSAIIECSFYPPGYPSAATMYDALAEDMGESMLEIYLAEVGYGLTADTASFTVAGQDVVLQASGSLAADTATFTLAGNAANLNAGFTLQAVDSSYTLSSTAVGLLKLSSISADLGTFTVTGNDVVLTRPVADIVADTQSFDLSGSTTGLLVKMPALSNAYNSLFNDVTFELSDNEFIGFWGTSPGVAGDDLGFWDSLEE